MFLTPLCTLFIFGVYLSFWCWRHSGVDGFFVCFFRSMFTLTVSIDRNVCVLNPGPFAPIGWDNNGARASRLFIAVCSCLARVGVKLGLKSAESRVRCHGAICVCVRVRATAWICDICIHWWSCLMCVCVCDRVGGAQDVIFAFVYNCTSLYFFVAYIYR